jgi:outer membrane protein TolC
MKRIFLSVILIIPILGWGLTIDQAVDMARQNNKDLQNERESVRRAEAECRNVRGSLLPQITLSGQYYLDKTVLPDATVNSIPHLSDMIDDGLSSSATANDSLAQDNDRLIAEYIDSAIIPSQVSKTAGINGQLKLEQVIFMSDLVNGLKVVNKARSISQKNYQLKERDVVFQARTLFNNLLLLREVVQVQREALDIARQHQSQVADMYEQGLVSEYDKLRADLEVAKLEPDLIQAQNNLDIVEHQFRDYIGWKDSELTLEGELTPPAPDDALLDDCIREAETNRIEADLSTINQQINEVIVLNAKQAYLPKVALSGEIDKYTSSSDTSIEGDEFGTKYQIGIGFSMPLFTGLSNQAKISKARADLRKSQIGHADLLDKIDLQVRNAYQTRVHDFERVNVQQKNVTLAQRGLEIAQARYENHVGIQLEVLDAQLQLRAARLAFLNAAHDAVISDLSLRKALGRDL